MTQQSRAVDYANTSLPELVALVQAGHQQAYRHIMQHCNQQLFRVARAVLNNDAEAEDALQEAWLHAWSHIQSFRSDARISTWLTRIVLNECYNRLRRRRPTVSLEGDEQTRSQVLNFPTRFGMEDPAHKASRLQAREIIEHAIETLSEPHRIVFMMRSVEEYSTAETASMLGIREETVKTRLHRARRQLRKILHETLEPTLHEAFPFLGKRCARITDTVMARISTTNPATGEN